MTDLLAALSALGLQFQETPFSDEIFTADGVAKSLGISLSQVAKAMLLRIGDGSTLVAVVPGDRRADLKQIKRHLNGKKVQIVERSHVEATIGLQVGAVTPLIALVNKKVAVVVDESLTKHSIINVSSGNLKLGININPLELASATSAAIAKISD
ncbi:aminoacyl-tRNA deacylase [Bradyrhizobium sp. USDA 3650]